MQFKKKKKYFILFVNADVRNLCGRTLFIYYTILFDYMLEFHKQ